MKTFRVLASYTSYCYMDIQAENLDEAREIAYNADGGDFTDQGLGDWNIDEITEEQA